MAVHGAESLEDAEAALTQDGYDVVRVGYSDIIGTERGRDVLVSRFARTVGDGIGFCRAQRTRAVLALGDRLGVP